MKLRFEKSNPFFRILSRLHVYHLFDDDLRTSFRSPAYGENFTVTFFADREEISVVPAGGGDEIRGLLCDSTADTDAVSVYFRGKESDVPKHRLLICSALLALAKIA